MFLTAIMVSGCVYRNTEKRSQTIRINTNPAGARIRLEDRAGEKVLGNSPLDLKREYEVVTEDYNKWAWIPWILSGASTAAGTGLFIARVDDHATFSDTLFAVGCLLLTAGVIGVAASGLPFSDYDGIDKPVFQDLTVAAELDGYLTSEIGLRIPSKRTEANLVLRKAPEPAPPKREAPAVTAPAAGPTAEGDRQIIAVFDVFDASKRIDKETLAQLTTYLGTALTKSGKYSVIPRDQLRARLLEEKKGTYRECVEESCQIELGKTLAAQKTLATQLLQVGKKCAVTANLFDLKTETAEKGAMVNTGCSPDELLDAMNQIAKQLSE